jgi:hypothetical protein
LPFASTLTRPPSPGVLPLGFHRRELSLFAATKIPHRMARQRDSHPTPARRTRDVLSAGIRSRRLPPVFHGVGASGGRRASGDNLSAQETVALFPPVSALLKPLGRPARNSTKFFATETLEQIRRDEKWLAKASDSIGAYWRRRNAPKRNKDTNKREPINRSVPELDQIRKILETE